MKKLLLLTLCMAVTTMLGQNVMFVHTATGSNSSGNVTYLDHPDLNGNPNARIAITHNYNPPGSGGIYNGNVSGAWYDGASWTVFNENLTDIVEGSSYNIFIMNNSESIVHVAGPGNQGANPSYSIVDHPSLNGNPDAIAVTTNYWNPNAIYNDYNYGFWYDGTNWNLYTESGADVPEGSAFFIAANPSNAVYTKHVATVSNISNNWTNIDHPLLNNNPDGIVVVTHNWGPDGGPNNVVSDKTVGVWYTGSNWAIYNEDLTPMPVDIAYDIMIYDPALGTNTAEFQVGMAPNPAKGHTVISSEHPIEQIQVYDVSGRLVMSASTDGVQYRLDTSALSSGTYLVQIFGELGTTSQKLIIR